MAIRNILITAEFYLPMYGGIEQYIKYLSRYFVENNIDVTVLCSKFKLDLPECQKIEGVDIIYCDFLNGALEDPFKILKNVNRIAEKIVNINPDMIMANNHSSLGVILAAKKSRVPVAYVCHGVGLMCTLKKRFLKKNDNLCWEGISFSGCSRCYMDNLSFRKIVGYFIKTVPNYFRYKYSLAILKKANLRIGNSSMTQCLFPATDRNYGFPLLIDVNNKEDGFYPENSQEFCDKYDLKYKEFILVPGRLNHIKGQIYAVRALKHLPDSIKMVFAGNSSLFSGDNSDLGEYGSLLKTEIEALGLKERIIFTGLLSTEQMRQAYSSARITVIPSLWIETFGYVTIESMACETPVIVTDNCGSAECVGEYGRVVERMSSIDIHDAVSEIWDAAIELGKKSRQRVIENYSVEVLGLKTLNILNGFVSEKNND